MDWDVWGLPLVVLGTSVVVGIFVAFRDQDQSIQMDTKSDLEAQKAQIMEQIRELDADKEKMDVDAYQRIRESYLQRAEGILEQLDRYQKGQFTEKHSKDITSTKTGTKTETQSMGWMTAVVILVFFSILGGLLGRYSKPRSDGEVMTGGSMDSRMASVEQKLQDMEVAKKKRVSDATKILEQDPKNIDAANVLTYESLLERDFQSAMKYIDIIRGQEPENPEMLVHLGVLQMSVGMSDRAQQVFVKALEQEPNLGKAMLWQGVLLANLGRTEESLVLAKKSLPLLTLEEERYFAERLIEELDKPPPILSGVVEGENSSKGVLFVIARRAEQGGGPPVAVQKIVNPTFPVSFEMGKSDMVMGGVWPDQIWIQARLDGDGNAMTKSEDDWESSILGPLEGEHQDIKLQLQGTKPKEDSIKESTNLDSNKSDSIESNRIVGRVVVEPEQQPQGGVLFIIARATEIPKGPPLAVRKFENPVFPLDFTMNDSHMMMGGTWPDEVWLSARLDGDGNAMTKSEDDWESSILGPLPNQSAETIQLMLKP